MRVEKIELTKPGDWKMTASSSASEGTKVLAQPN